MLAIHTSSGHIFSMRINFEWKDLSGKKITIHHWVENRNLESRHQNKNTELKSHAHSTKSICCSVSLSDFQRYGCTSSEKQFESYQDNFNINQGEPQYRWDYDQSSCLHYEKNQKFLSDFIGYLDVVNIFHKERGSSFMSSEKNWEWQDNRFAW